MHSLTESGESCWARDGLVAWEQCNLDLRPRRNIWNLLRAGNFNYVVPVAALACNEVKRSDSVRPNLIYAAHLEQEVLFRFIYFCASNPKMLSDWNRVADVYIQSTRAEMLPRCSFEDFGIFIHTAREMLQPLCLRANESFQNYHCRYAARSSRMKNCDVRNMLPGRLYTYS
jgi:hypothetical protein